MSWSAAEIAALAGRAARGAGFPPAQAEMFGRAAAWHLGQGGDPAPVLRALDDPQDSPILRLPLLMEDLRRVGPLAGEAITLSLQAGDDALAPAYVWLQPLKVVALQTEPADPPRPARMHVTLAPGEAEPPAAAGRADLPEAVQDRLTRLARATLVPESDASRRRGAGAGDIDND